MVVTDYFPSVCLAVPATVTVAFVAGPAAALGLPVVAQVVALRLDL